MLRRQKIASGCTDLSLGSHIFDGSFRGVVPPHRPAELPSEITRRLTEWEAFCQLGEPFRWRKKKDSAEK